MILLALNPLSKGVAIAEMLILLFVIALLGFLLGRWVINRQTNSFSKQITETAEALDACQKQKDLP